MTNLQTLPHHADFIFETEYADSLYAVLYPETTNNPGEKSVVEIIKYKSEIHLKIAAEDISSLRAALNMWFRLIAVSTEILAL